ncbi:Pachytene checkpoint protein 2-like protein [Frankliniella fusca]|uniref:Pachytene checkpoint protein 2-like protein n=1 Tax=Frankliniella fusca TaxID=407009 RepID=A0AAE1LA85_9NEOP|nr:Pachytene checkpoint protein 2-like protein [Frankliniella fusca]
MKPTLHVEVVQKNESNLLETTLTNYVLAGLAGKVLTRGITFNNWANELLADHVESIHICDDNNPDSVQSVQIENFDPQIHIYKLNNEGVQVESIESGDGDGQEVSAAHHWLLPSRDFHGLWESLIYESNIKENLLQCMETTLLFSDRNVSPFVITWNRVILLHGPPGTGKTSLSKALAQKLAIRLSKRYSHAQLLEVNSHSLFSKWFSESGKLVMRMFSKVRELAENQDALVVILIDEVESLTQARTSHSGVEPSDAIRTVNAVLTQLDNLKQYTNVLIMATSNVTDAIDLAFVDRADIKQYIGPPPVKGIYSILASCINELKRVSIISPSGGLYSYDLVSLTDSSENSIDSQTLLQISKDCEGLNGRTLRKLPYLAHALFIQKPSSSLKDFLEALAKTVVKHKNDVEALKKK